MLTTYWSLARWLGPWADADRAPPARRQSLWIEPTAPGDRRFEAWYYLPVDRPLAGAYLIAPGLHYAGPRDPRMNRFCSVLAAAGFAVLAPFLPDYTALQVAPTCLGDFERCWLALLARPELPAGSRPGVFSISFGSLPALWLASRGRARDRIGGLLVFGGYARWDQTIRFSLTGQITGQAAGQRDLLNQPVVFMNLIGELANAPADPAPLLAGWRRYVEATWGREELKRGRAHIEIARRHARDLPEPMRQLFLIGCGALPGGIAAAEAALARSPARTAFLDPTPLLAGIDCPVDLVHGIDDDVIPYVESTALAAGLPSATVHLTGLYGHTSSAGGSGRGATALARELATMARILRRFARAGRVSRRRNAST